MQFIFETEYNQKAIKAMAYLMRKTIRKKKNRRSRIFGWAIAAIAIILTLPVLRGHAPLKINTVLTWLAALVIVVTLLFEDTINAYAAKRRMLAGTDKATVVFEEDKFISSVSVGKTEFDYRSIAMIAENKEYFVFILDARYAQLYDKSKLTGGSVEEFRHFITEKTGKAVLIC